MGQFSQALPPGLAGYAAGAQENERRDLSQLQQATMAQGLLASIQDRQAQNQMRQLLAQTGGDPEAALEAALKTGNIQAAHQLAPVVKLAQEKRDQQAMAGLDMSNPETLRAVGLKTKRPEFVTHAERIEKRREEQATLDQMKSSPGAASYGGGGDFAIQEAKPGIFSDLIKSEVPGIAAAAKNLQAQVDRAGPGIPVAYWQKAKDDLFKREEAFLGRKALLDSKAAKPADEPPTITNDTLSMDAWRYLTDGTLPPNMGRGVQGSAQAAAIRNEASRLAKDMGMSPDEIRMAQLTNKTQVAAIAQLGKARAQILQFEKTASANADLALEASEKVDRTGMPVLNRWIQAGRVNIQGDPEAAKFHAATETFVSEYAKVMSGGYGSAATTEGAQNRAHQLLNTANTKEQFRAVVGQLKREMDNRVKALNGQMEEERGRLRGGIRPDMQNPAPAAAPPAAPAGEWKITPVK